MREVSGVLSASQPLLCYKDLDMLDPDIDPSLCATCTVRSVTSEAIP